MNSSFSPSSPPAYDSSTQSAADQNSQEAFNNLIKRYELSPFVSNQLLDVLMHREIVLLCDDSSSMTNIVIEEGNDPFSSNNITRWQLLKKIAASIIDFVTAVNHQKGLDLYFLKRETVRNVTTREGLQSIFQRPPDEMGTPLLGALNRIYSEKSGHSGLLIVVITDGEPNDGTRDDLRRVLLSKPKDCHISFAEATDQEEDMDYLDALKGVIPLFDNTDIYKLELQKVKNIQGQQFKFDWTDYIIKILLATFLQQYWNVDQRNVSSAFYSNIRSNGKFYAQTQKSYQTPNPSTFKQVQQFMAVTPSAPNNVGYIPPPATSPSYQQEQQSGPQQFYQPQYILAQAPKKPSLASSYPPRYAELVKRLELDQITAADLYLMVSTCEIVLLCDDSGSMQTMISQEIGAPPGPRVSRWDELKRLAATLIDMITCINIDGLDVTFLNRPGLSRVTDKQGLQPLFQNLPRGPTPLLTALTRIINTKRNTLPPNKHLLVIIATDGEPSDCSPTQLFNYLYNNLNTFIHVSAVECTDDEESMNFMDSWNTQIITFDNTDDYRVDLQKVKRRMGINYKYDYHNWVVKILLGSFLQKYKVLDQQLNGCCTIS